MNERFTSILSCYFSFTSNQKLMPCTLSIDISQSLFTIKIYFTYYGEQKIIDFKYSEYNEIDVNPVGCIFIHNENVEKNAYFFFFNNDNDVKRFFFILADSGMIIPRDIDMNESNLLIDSAKLDFLHHHSFVPKGNYTFIYPSIINNIKKILKNRVKRLKKSETLPFNETYYESVYPYLHKIEERKMKNLKIRNKNKISDSFSSPDQTTLIIKMVSRAGIQNQKYKQLQKEMQNNQTNENYSYYFQMIEDDYNEMNDNLIDLFYSSVYTEKITKKVSSICMNVCKVYATTEKGEYFQNNLFIAMKIALLLIGGDRIQNFVECSFAGDSKKDMNSILELIPDDINKITANNENFENLVYSLYSYLMSSISSGISEILYNSFNFFMSYLDNLIPYSGAFFFLKKITSFKWLEEMVRNLFLFSFKSPWIAWLFIMRANDHETAVQAIIASIVYHMVPKAIEQKVDSEKSIEIFLQVFDEELQNDGNLIKDIVDIATCFYFYQKPSSAKH